MGTAAAAAALADAGATAADVDAIILATSTPDQAFPASALRVQAALGVKGASASTCPPPVPASSTPFRSPTA